MNRRDIARRNARAGVAGARTFAIPDPTRFVTEGRFRRVMIAFMALGFLGLIAAGLAAAWVVRQNQSHTFWVNHTYQVENALVNAQRLVEESETSRRGELLAPAYSNFTSSYRQASAGVPKALDRIGTLTRDNPRQRATLARVRSLVEVQLVRERLGFQLVGAGQRDVAVRAFAAELTDKRLRAIRNTFSGMAAEERSLLLQRDADQRGSVRLFYMVLGLAGVLVLLVAAISLLVVLRFTRDLTGSRDSLRLLNDTLEEQVTTRTADLTRANEEIQRFAYIVSHDLRSPLVNVMGFTAELEAAARALAELVDRAEADAPHLLTVDAREAARVDLPEAIGFIRTSTQRMDRLIATILKLAREGRRTITPEPIDLDAMVGAIRDSLTHQLDAEGTVLLIDAPLPAVTTDRLAIEQILSNLIENAAKYLQPGRPGRITVSGERVAARVVVAVADNGRGIAPADHARVFDLFRRSGKQDKPGEGIGLAHVRALAYRLGGTVDMTSELGQGTTFRLTLPIEHGALPA